MNIKQISSDFMADRKITQEQAVALSVLHGYMAKEIDDLWDTLDNEGVDNIQVLAEIRVRELELELI